LEFPWSHIDSIISNQSEHPHLPSLFDSIITPRLRFVLYPSPTNVSLKDLRVSSVIDDNQMSIEDRIAIYSKFRAQLATFRFYKESLDLRIIGAPVIQQGTQ
jgi:hypothetical protein